MFTAVAQHFVDVHLAVIPQPQVFFNIAAVGSKSPMPQVLYAKCILLVSPRHMKDSLYKMKKIVPHGKFLGNAHFRNISWSKAYIDKCSFCTAEV